MKNPSDLTVQTWARLIRAHQSTFSYVENALKNNGQPPLIWYDVLLELERVGAKGLRPYELERALMLKQYGVSRLVDRIEKSGHLKREVCEDDGRGLRLTITTRGKELRRQMWTIYGPAIEDAVGVKLSPKQAKTLSEFLNKLIC